MVISTLPFRSIAVFVLLLLAAIKGFGQKDIYTQEYSQEKSFDSDGSKSDDKILVVPPIVISGNQTTHPNVILRELEFAQGDTIKHSLLNSALITSRQNLLNTGLFNFVEVQLQHNGDSVVAQNTINISVTERWYIWPFPRIEIADRTFVEWLRDPALSTLNYGLLLSWQNFRGRREELHLDLKVGHSEHIWFSYEIPFLNRAKTLGAIVDVGFSRRREAFFDFYKNRPLRLEFPNEHIVKRFSAHLGFTYRRAIHNIFSLTFGYNHLTLVDTLVALNPQLSPSGLPESEFLSIQGSFTHDKRDFRPYPLQGRFVRTAFTMQLPDLVSNKYPNFSGINFQWREYAKLSDRWYFAMGLHSGFSIGSNRQLHNQMGIGRGIRPVRGYENFTVFGQHFVTVNSNAKFVVVPYRKARIPFLPGERFGLFHYSLYFNVFADTGYIEDRHFGINNHLNNTWLASMGVGLDFVTYYDIVVRTEFAVTRHNTGFQLHFTAPV